MNLRLSLIAAATAGLAVACAASTAQEVRSPKAQKQLAEALQGRVAGRPQSCIPNYRANHMTVIDDWTILFRDGRTVYVQNPRGGCRGLGFGGYTLVTRNYGSQLCNGQINNLVDLRTGMMGGACVFSEFVPYTKPRS